MSLKTWREEFYPKSAGNAKAAGDDLIAHSLRKWEGLRPENLEKHDVRWGFERILDGFAIDGFVESLAVDANSCALCAQHYRHSVVAYCDLGSEEMGDEHACSTCPLCQVRGGVPCDASIYDEDGEKISPYGVGTRGRDPEPMIMWLKKAARG